MLDSIYHMPFKLFWNPFLRETLGFCHMRDVKKRHFHDVSRKSVNH